jgi:hypothetical protein
MSNKIEIKRIVVNESELDEFDNELEFFDKERKKKVEIKKITLSNGQPIEKK